MFEFNACPDFTSGACEVFEIKELTFVNDCFKHKQNAEIGHYRQVLYNQHGITVCAKMIFLFYGLFVGFKEIIVPCKSRNHH